MLAPVLTLKWNDPVSLSKYEATRRKENKETGNDYVLSISGVLWNCREESREMSINPAVNIKAGSITEEEESSFQSAKDSNS